MNCFQVMLMACVVVSVYCSYDPDKSPNELLMKSLFEKESLFDKISDLLKKSDHPLAQKFADLIHFDKSFCEMRPVDQLEVTIGRKEHGTGRLEPRFKTSEILNAYLKHCADKIKKECKDNGTPMKESELIFTEKGYDLSQRIKKEFEKGLEPEETFNLLKRYSLDSSVFPWVELHEPDISECRGIKSIYYPDYYHEYPKSLLIYFNKVKDNWNSKCKELLDENVEKFLKNLERVKQDTKLVEKMKKIEIESLLPFLFTDSLNRDSDRDIIPYLHQRSKIFYAFPCTVKNVCNEYIKKMGENDVKKFVLMNAKENFKKKEEEFWLRALIACDVIVRDQYPGERIYIDAKDPEIRNVKILSASLGKLQTYMKSTDRKYL